MRLVSGCGNEGESGEKPDRPGSKIVWWARSGVEVNYCEDIEVKFMC